MRLLITGATGFIGSHLVKAATERGHEVITLSRSGRRLQSVAAAFSWSLGDPPPPEALQDINCAIHLAHDYGGEDGARRTIECTLAIAAELRRRGVDRQLFFSSYSAGENATSRYGKTKLAIERALASQEDITIVRPGLVVGGGGIYGRIRKWAQRLPLIPLPDGGLGKVAVIGIGDLCERTLRLATMMNPPREENLSEPDLKSLRELVLKAAEEVGCRPRILPVSSGLLIRLLFTAECIGIPLPVTADNVVGFIANQDSQHKPMRSQGK
jgi:uncharacterized protein YbjT (DUF2867 family)